MLYATGIYFDFGSILAQRTCAVIFFIYIDLLSVKSQEPKIQGPRIDKA